MFVYNLLMDTETSRSKVRKRKAALNVSFCVKKEKNTAYKKVSNILRKPLAERSNDEIEFLDNSKDIVQEISNKQAQRQKIKDRSQEYEDPANVLAEKCKILADAVINSNHLVVYTGAGISTAARIPDYRGSNGIWTLLQQGKDIGLHDLSQAEPTLTHMALYSLYRRGILKHVVSQNCDGLHLRSGLPKKILSEVHGNMYLEVCSKCKPSNHYWRLFDVTEYTARYSHETLRLCYECGNPLKDTIVHFGERGKLQWPLNWDTACKQADKADVILCLGSSLKVLKKYPWLWCMDKPAKKRPKLYIVNLQWTPKDDHSTLKINGKCDTVIEQMMSHLSLDVPKYHRSLDPIFHHATPLHECELHTTSRSPIEKNPKTVGCVTIQHSPDMKPKREDENSKSDAEEGDDTSMCSASQAISSVAEANSHAIDLISPNGLVVEDDVVDIKKENASNTYSDKENIDTDDDAKSRNSTVGSVKVEPTDQIDCDNGQSNLSVISDQSSDYIVPEICVKMEDCENESMSMDTQVVEECDDGAEQETLTVAAENLTFFSENASVVPYPTWTADMAILQNNALQWYFGRNPWSDLSLFDIFTQKPIFFTQPMLGFGSNLVSYPNANVTPIFGSFLNYASILPSTSSPSGVSIAEVVPADILPDCETKAASSSVPESSAVVPEAVAEEASCAFCFDRYKSKNCLFYTEHSSNDPLDAGSVCLCCGGDEDDDQADGEEPPAEESADKTAGKVNINPGWFGKGYRKRIKKRKG